VLDQLNHDLSLAAPWQNACLGAPYIVERPSTSGAHTGPDCTTLDQAAGPAGHVMSYQIRSSSAGPMLNLQFCS